MHKQPQDHLRGSEEENLARTSFSILSISFREKLLYSHIRIIEMK